MIYQRNCPICNVVLTCTDRSNFTHATKKNSWCMKCSMSKRMNPEIAKKLSKSLMGIKRPNRASNTREGKELKYWRVCPSCKKDIGYVIKWSCTRANRDNAICNSCSNEVYKKSWIYVIKDEHIKKMAAKKAGYETFTAYMADLDKKKKYYREVRLITKQQNISLLENFDKLRGLCGVEGAYQLDHVISVSKGYQDNISPDIIGSISNLQIVPWKINLLKSK